MIENAAYVVSVLIGWYTFNIARLAWSAGNKSGAVLTGTLAFGATAFPLAILLISKN